ncbi:hypothetical protein VTK26DRAFT_4689 [Humicola hyalothermophila]
MSRRSTPFPHIPPSEPRQGASKAPARLGKRPLTGYDLLADRLASPGPHDLELALNPVYRKFEVLHHRLLLHLQDELVELEEQLHQLDIIDTQNRWVHAGHILPASRRAEAAVGGNFHRRKTDVLERIGFLLGQYSNALKSFTEIQSLPRASTADVAAYRAFLAAHEPITESETQFLDPVQDLISLNHHYHHHHRPTPPSPVPAPFAGPTRGFPPVPAKQDPTPPFGEASSPFSTSHMNALN